MYSYALTRVVGDDLPSILRATAGAVAGCGAQTPCREIAAIRKEIWKGGKLANTKHLNTSAGKYFHPQGRYLMAWPCKEHFRNLYRCLKAKRMLIPALNLHSFSLYAVSLFLI